MRGSFMRDSFRSRVQVLLAVVRDEEIDVVPITTADRHQWLRPSPEGR